MTLVKQKNKRWVALGVCICFVATLFPEAHAALPSIEMAAKIETPRILNIDIPTELASVDEWYQAPSKSKPKLIVHIQDAHANYEAQTKIRDVIKYLNTNYGFKTILVEGAASELDPNILKLFPDQERNLKLVDELAKIGEVTGAEMFLVENSDAAKGVGIEKPELYRKNFDALQKVYSEDEFVGGFFEAYEKKLGQISSRSFGPRMIQALAEWRKFENGHRDFLPFVSSLAELSKKVLDIDLGVLYSQIEWPQLTRLLVLQRVEKELDRPSSPTSEVNSRHLGGGAESSQPEVKLREQALIEKQQIIDLFKKAATTTLAPGASSRSGLLELEGLIKALEKFDEKTANLNRIGSSEVRQASAPRALMEALVEEGGKVGFNIREYPAFAKYAGYLILRGEIVPGDLFEEIKKLFDLVLESLVKDAPSAAIEASDDLAARKRLLLLHRDEMLARKLLKLELSHDEWLAVLNRQDRFYPDDLNRRMLEQLGQNTRVKEVGGEEAAQMKKLNEAFRAAFAFYSAAVNRDTFFFQRTREVLAQTDKAILITGGFHAEGMKYFFRKYDINYGTVTPRITQTFSNEQYRKVMMIGSEEAQASKSKLQVTSEEKSLKQKKSVKENYLGAENLIDPARASLVGEQRTKVRWMDIVLKIANSLGLRVRVPTRTKIVNAQELVNVSQKKVRPQITSATRVTQRRGDSRARRAFIAGLFGAVAGVVAGVALSQAWHGGGRVGSGDGLRTEASTVTIQDVRLPVGGLRGIKFSIMKDPLLGELTDERLAKAVALSNRPDIVDKVRNAYRKVIDAKIFPDGTFYPVLFLSFADYSKFSKESLGDFAYSGAGFIVIPAEALDMPTLGLEHKIAHEATHLRDRQMNPSISIIESEANAWANQVKMMEAGEIKGIVSVIKSNRIQWHKDIAKAFIIIANDPKFITDSLGIEEKKFAGVSYARPKTSNGHVYMELSFFDRVTGGFVINLGNEKIELLGVVRPEARSEMRVKDVVEFGRKSSSELKEWLKGWGNPQIRVNLTDGAKAVAALTVAVPIIIVSAIFAPVPSMLIAIISLAVSLRYGIPGFKEFKDQNKMADPAASGVTADGSPIEGAPTAEEAVPKTADVASSPLTIELIEKAKKDLANYGENQLTQLARDLIQFSASTDRNENDIRAARELAIILRRNQISDPAVKTKLSILPVELAIKLSQFEQAEKLSSPEVVVTARVSREGVLNSLTPDEVEILRSLTFEDLENQVKAAQDLSPSQAVAILVTFGIISENDRNAAKNMAKLASLVIGRVAPEQTSELSEMLRTFYPEAFNDYKSVLIQVMNGKNFKEQADLIKLYLIINPNLNVKIVTYGTGGNINEFSHLLIKQFGDRFEIVESTEKSITNTINRFKLGSINPDFVTVSVPEELRITSRNIYRGRLVNIRYEGFAVEHHAASLKSLISFAQFTRSELPEGMRQEGGNRVIDKKSLDDLIERIRQDILGMFKVMQSA